jgi:hypothetical protein
VCIETTLAVWIEVEPTEARSMDAAATAAMELWEARDFDESNVGITAAKYRAEKGAIRSVVIVDE